ncbi:IclR family transcriptional regulator [Amycolatopsis antarctica]|uniref:Glycerol operon regulatory protein n=1 Tax=Amycolatopsis antarctica TaxID=1854586 RepID=A0A263D242_9PSEU|nr:IclR family transcriptional regulator [Amycolatopsis antarctica]OZM72279.1 IclR family transcriptional regulator [Amycolatopsis antarctica]
MGNSDDGKPPVLVQSVDRAISVLELLARKGGAGITEIAGELGVHKSTVSRLLGALEARGMVEQEGERGKFTIGFGIVRLAGAATAQLDLARLGTPVCESLAEQLGETVNIAVLDGSVAINISQARGTAAVAAQNWTGQRTPLHATSSGKVLLAGAEESERERILGVPQAPYTPRTVTDAAELRTMLRLVAKDGYATSFEELELGLHAVSVPVHGQGEDVVAAISVSGPAYRLSRKRLRQMVDDLRAGAGELSNQLGYFTQ